MEEKKIISREEFETLCNNGASQMKKDKQLMKDATDVFSRADQYHWIHQTRKMGGTNFTTSSGDVYFSGNNL